MGVVLIRGQRHALIRGQCDSLHCTAQAGPPPPRSVCFCGPTCCWPHTPLRATKEAVLSTMALMSGGGRMTPIALVCVANCLMDASCSFVTPSAVCTSPDATMAVVKPVSLAVRASPTATTAMLLLTAGGASDGAGPVAGGSAIVVSTTAAVSAILRGQLTGGQALWGAARQCDHRAPLIWPPPHK